MSMKLICLSNFLQKNIQNSLHINKISYTFAALDVNLNTLT